MKCSLMRMQWIAGFALLATAAFWAVTVCGADDQSEKSLAQQIFETMVQLPGYNSAYRAAHAKGIVCEGTFTPSKDAATLSKAAHFQGGSIRVIITSVVPDSDTAQKTLVFFPTNLTDGIELSDDPFPALRTSVYALSFARRQQP